MMTPEERAAARVLARVFADPVACELANSHRLQMAVIARYARRAGRAIVVVIALALSACSGPSHADRAALVFSTAAMVVDWGQTHDAAANGWSRAQESNPLLGRTPSTRVVDAYFASAIAVTAAVWYLLPTGWRGAWASSIATVEVPSVIDNYQRTEFVGFGAPAPPALGVIRQWGARR